MFAPFCDTKDVCSFLWYQRCLLNLPSPAERATFHSCHDSQGHFQSIIYSVQVLIRRFKRYQSVTPTGRPVPLKAIAKVMLHYFIYWLLIVAASGDSCLINFPTMYKLYIILGIIILLYWLSCDCITNYIHSHTHNQSHTYVHKHTLQSELSSIIIPTQAFTVYVRIAAIC